MVAHIREKSGDKVVGQKETDEEVEWTWMAHGLIVLGEWERENQEEAWILSQPLNSMPYVHYHTPEK